MRHLAHGGRITLPADYVVGQVQLLYATTAHRAQGTTVDTAHPLITAGMTREALYVLATRARQKTVFYVATHDHPFDQDARVDLVRHDPRQYAGREVLLNVLATEGAPLPATETIAETQERAGSLPVLVPRYLHAAHEDAGGRYQLAAVEALGESGGRELAADPAWDAVVRRLFDAEDAGWDPARLLATVAARRELHSAESVAEVIAWRIDGFLAGSPVPPMADETASDCQPYESAAETLSRLTGITVTVLGTPLADRAQGEVAWPALIGALRRVESAGFDPADALTRTATARELRTVRSVSEVLAWRISRHVAAHPAVGSAATGADPVAASPPGSPEPAVARAGVLLPWVPGPRQVSSMARGVAPLTAYIDDAATAISARIAELADTAVRHRPPWMNPLGEPPNDPDRARQWRRHVEIIAAYRDQHSVTADDPRQVLGPYAESGRAGHGAYWHAAESVLAARRLSGLDPSDGTGIADGQARGQVAADIYGALPRAEREAIATAIAETAGVSGSVTRTGRTSTLQLGPGTRTC